MKATKATVANAAVISSAITANANNNSDLPVQAKRAKSKFVKAAPTPQKESKNKSNSSITKTKNIKKKQIVDTNDVSTEPTELDASSKATENKKED